MPEIMDGLSTVDKLLEATVALKEAITELTEKVHLLTKEVSNHPERRTSAYTW